MLPETAKRQDWDEREVLLLETWYPRGGSKVVQEKLAALGFKRTRLQIRVAASYRRIKSQGHNERPADALLGEMTPVAKSFVPVAGWFGMSKARGEALFELAESGPMTLAEYEHQRTLIDLGLQEMERAA